MDPDHDREIAGQGLGVHVQREAVLVDNGGQEGGTGTSGAMLKGISHSGPGCRVDGSTETEITDGGGSVRDTLVGEVGMELVKEWIEK